MAACEKKEDSNKRETLARNANKSLNAFFIHGDQLSNHSTALDATTQSRLKSPQTAYSIRHATQLIAATRSLQINPHLVNLYRAYLCRTSVCHPNLPAPANRKIVGECCLIWRLPSKHDGTTAETTRCDCDHYNTTQTQP